MSKLPQIVKDLAGDNYEIDEDLKRLEGKTIKKCAVVAAKLSKTDIKATFCILSARMVKFLP